MSANPFNCALLLGIWKGLCHYLRGQKTFKVRVPAATNSRYLPPADMKDTADYQKNETRSINSGACASSTENTILTEAQDYPGLRLQLPADPIVQNARVLIVSLHGGTAKDTAMQFFTAGVRMENIACLVWMFYSKIMDTAPCVRDKSLEVLVPVISNVSGWPYDIDPPDDTWVDSFAEVASPLVADYDILIADFPSVLSLLFDRVAPHKVIVRPTHRMDHQAKHSGDFGTTYAQQNLLRLYRNAPVVLAGSEYDWWYIRYYSCRRAGRAYLSWPTQYFESLGANMLTDQKSGFILWGGTNKDGSESIMKYFEQIRDLVRKRNASEALKVLLKEKPEGFQHASEFASEQGVIYFPYSMPSSSFHELYSSGVPIIAPSLKLMLAEFSEGRGYPHKVAGNSACGKPSFSVEGSSDVLCCGQGEDDPPCLDPNSCDEEALKYWVTLGDIYTTPNITYFDSADDALRIMEEWTANPRLRHEIASAMRRHAHETILRNGKEMQDAIRQISCASGQD